MKQIYGIGEIVLDIIFKDDVPAGAKPGGSVLNALVSLGRCGIPVSFISELGDDLAGGMITRFLKENNVETQHILHFDDGKTAIAIAFLDEHNEASYNFYKHYPRQRLNDKLPQINSNDFFVFGSFYGLDRAVRDRVKDMLETSRRNEALIYYDPNFRSSHLHELPDLLPLIKENFEYADIIRGSDEDFRNILGTQNGEDTYREIKPYSSYLLYTSNKNGAEIFTPTDRIHVPAQKISPVSTIGAGDNFNAGVLYALHQKKIDKHSLDQINQEDWTDITTKGIHFASQACLSLDNYVSHSFAQNIVKADQ